MKDADPVDLRHELRSRKPAGRRETRRMVSVASGTLTLKVRISASPAADSPLTRAAGCHLLDLIRGGAVPEG